MLHRVGWRVNPLYIQFHLFIASADRTADIQKSTRSKHGTAVSTTPLHYLKAIRSVRLSVEALSFKASFAAFALC